jgi:hypothetical protein
VFHIIVQVCTGAVVGLVDTGGETGFIKRIIEESILVVSQYRYGQLTKAIL